jgi:hypothetical protein
LANTFTEEEQSKLLDFAIHQGASVRKIYTKRDKKASAAVTKKRKNLAKKRDDAAKKKLEKKFNYTLSKGALLVDLLKEFPALDRAIVDRFDSFIRGSDCMVGCRLSHVWVEEGVECEYIEVIKALKV